MEELLLLALVVLAVIQLAELSKIKRTLRELEDGLRELRRKLPWQSEKIVPVAKPEPAPVASSSAAVAAPTPVPVQPPPIPVVRPGLASPASPPAPAPVLVRTVSPPPAPNSTVQAARDILRRIWSWIVVGEEHRTPGVSMEYAVATTWLIRAGIVIIVTCVGYFLQWSMDRNLLGPEGPRRAERFFRPGAADRRHAYAEQAMAACWVRALWAAASRSSTSASTPPARCMS
jgi:uncharacterized membrane protein